MRKKREPAISDYLAAFIDVYLLPFSVTKVVFVDATAKVHKK